MNTDATHLDQLMVHAAWLRRFARALLRDGDDADDLVQSTLVAAWQHPPADPDRPRSWLARIAQNRAKDFRKAENRRDVRELTAAELVPESPAMPEQLVGDMQIHRTVAEVVTALEEPFRETVLLRYYEGLSAAEIATRLKTPAGTIRWRLKEGLDRVRRGLDVRCEGDRRRWTMALAPLLPTLAGRQPGSAEGPRPPAPVGSIRVGPLAAVGALVVASGGLMTAALWPRSPAPAGGNEVVALEGAPPAAASEGAAPGRSAGPRLAPARGTAAAAAAVPGGEIPSEADTIARQMLGAIAGGSYDDFMTHAGDVLKAAIGKPAVEDLSRQLAAGLERGFKLEPMGIVRREGHVEYLWKLDLGEAEDEYLLRLALEDGRAVLFAIH